MLHYNQEIVVLRSLLEGRQVTVVPDVGTVPHGLGDVQAHGLSQNHDSRGDQQIDSHAARPMTGIWGP